MDNGGVVGYGVSCHFQQYFSHIVAFSFVASAGHDGHRMEEVIPIIHKSCKEKLVSESQNYL
jgi:hypothetical protein